LAAGAEARPYIVSAGIGGGHGGSCPTFVDHVLRFTFYISRFTFHISFFTFHLSSLFTAMTQLIEPPIISTSSNGIHSQPIAGVYPALQTHPQGLTQDEAETRLQRVGPNVLQEARGRPLIFKFLSNFTHLMAILLWIGGFVGFIAQQPQLGIAIWLVNIINGLFSFWQEFKAERATEALRRLLPTYARVLRDNEERRILAEELVPGDVMLLAEGDHISADARLVREAELRVDQSTLSGESHPARKTAEAVLRDDLAHVELPNMVFAGTSVAAGTGTAVVVATGMATEFGKIAHLTQSVGEEQSPLQKEMGRVTRQVSAMAVGIGITFFFLAVALAGVGLAESFIFAMGMIVAFVPEGMLPTVTLALALGTQRMARRHALVKRLSAVETLGSTTVICTDKTGTLTQNEMTVREVWAGGRRFSVSGTGYAPQGSFSQAGRPVSASNDDLRRLLIAAKLCNNARLLPPNGETARWTALGDPTEAALLVSACKGGLDLAHVAAQAPRIRELPFDSRRKRMSTIHDLSRAEPQIRDRQQAARIAFVKGAPREVLDLCTRIRIDGQVCPLDDELRTQILAANDDYARAGLRVLAVAERPLDAPGDKRDGATQWDAETIERELTFLGLQAMLDPPRPEVAAAVEQCRRAGIRIIMITGDYGLTAESIARRIGIVQGEHPRIISGVELDALDDTALHAALQDEVIFARVAPEHKLRVVSALRDLGQTVAVTGDGVNDAPALKKADIGVAMGITGTAVSKEAADMVLTDDNFASIQAAVEEGRRVYDNLIKALAFDLPTNLGLAVILTVAVAFFPIVDGEPLLPMRPVQILWINLVAAVALALPLALEAMEPNLMQRPPRQPDAPVLTPFIIARTVVVALLMAAGAVGLFLLEHGAATEHGTSGWAYAEAQTEAVTTVILFQIFYLFNCRSLTDSFFRIGVWSNPWVYAGISVVLLLQIAFVYLPWANVVFGSAPLGLDSWLRAAAVAFLIMPIIGAEKWWRRRHAGRRRPPKLTAEPSK
jgi:magnesium-transporting ATPase (P-type)